MIMPRKQVKLKASSNTDTLFKLPVPIPEPQRMVNIKPSVPDLSINCEDEKEEAAHLGLNFDYQQHRPVEVVNGQGSGVNREKSNDKDVDILKEIARINQRIRRNGLKDNLITKDTRQTLPLRRNGKETSPKDKSASRLAVSPSSSGKSFSKDLPTDSAALYGIIRSQTEKLDRLAEQVQLLLSLSLKKSPEKRSVGTMTNFPIKSRPDKSVIPRRSSERSKKKISDSGLLTSESESRSDGSESQSQPKVREDYYEKILRKVDQRLSNSRSEQSESLSSNSPPRGNRSLPTSSRATDEIDMINKLAEKYLKNDKADNKSRRGHTKKTSLSEGEEQKLRRSKRSSSRHPPKTVSDFTEEASIGVANYFEKYGLYDD